MTDPRTNPVPDNAVHVKLPPVQVRGFNQLFTMLSTEFDLPSERTVDPDRLAGSWREEEELRNDLPEEDGDG